MIAITGEYFRDLDTKILEDLIIEFEAWSNYQLDSARTLADEAKEETGPYSKMRLLDHSIAHAKAASISYSISKIIKVEIAKKMRKELLKKIFKRSRA